MSIQTNFRASDMLGTVKPEVKAAVKPVAKPAKITPKAAPIVEAAPVVEDVVVVEATDEVVEAPTAE